MEQHIINGLDSIRKIVEGKKYLLVCDAAYDLLPVKEMLDEYNGVKFCDFTSNPLYEQVCAGVKRFCESNCEMIVAVGGGSAIDVAKCIKLFCKMNTDTNFLEQAMYDTKVPLVAIPTTAGTGSESTKHAVIYYKRQKQSISHSSILPNYAILDPTVLKTLPIYQKKCTMMDALCQAIESWWSIRANDESKQYAKEAIHRITSYWNEYLEENTEKAAREIMYAANYAGRAINITTTTAAHAMSYKITSLYGLPHGHAVVVCMQELWKYMLKHQNDCVDPRGEEYFVHTMNEIEKSISMVQCSMQCN